MIYSRFCLQTIHAIYYHLKDLGNIKQRKEGYLMRKRFISMNVASGSIQIILSRNYWRAFKKAQVYFGSKARVRVWEDKLSTINGVR